GSRDLVERFAVEPHDVPSVPVRDQFVAYFVRPEWVRRGCPQHDDEPVRIGPRPQNALDGLPHRETSHDGRVVRTRVDRADGPAIADQDSRYCVKQLTSMRNRELRGRRPKRDDDVWRLRDETRVQERNHRFIDRTDATRLEVDLVEGQWR